jgi:transcriptional regulator with XRE-family HTH domain
MAEFKDVIQKLRAEKSFNQERLANELGVSKSTVAMWETGKRTPSPEVYEFISDYFNVDMDYLYGKTDIKKRTMFDEDGSEYVYVALKKAKEMNEVYRDESAMRILSYWSQMNSQQKESLESVMKTMVENKEK